MPCLIVFSPKIRLDKIVCLHCVCIRVRVCLYFVHLVVFAVCGYLDGTEKTHTLTQYKETKKIQRFYLQPMGDSIFGSKYDFSFWNYAEPAQEWKAILFFSAFSRVVYTTASVSHAFHTFVCSPTYKPIFIMIRSLSFRHSSCMDL